MTCSMYTGSPRFLAAKAATLISASAELFVFFEMARLRETDFGEYPRDGLNRTGIVRNEFEHLPAMFDR
jgi:hypothetical protein